MENISELEFVYDEAFDLSIAHKDGFEYLRRKGTPEDVSYKQVKEGKVYICTKCGGQVMTAKIAHSIWDGPFPISGSGKCHYEHVPYCPECEEKPGFSGAPIETNPRHLFK